MKDTVNRDPGFAIYNGVFDAPGLGSVHAALSSNHIVRSRAGARHVLGISAVHQLASDSRLLGIAASFVSPGALPFRATLFDKSSTSNWPVTWHQDTALPLREATEDPSWGPWSEKGGVKYAHAPAWALERVVALRVHLDDSTAPNGPLRVLPDTHTKGVLSSEVIDQLAREIPSVECVAAAGGVVAMRPLTVHASSKSTDDAPRRVLHIEYARSLQLAPGVELAIT